MVSSSTRPLRPIKGLLGCIRVMILHFNATTFSYNQLRVKAWSSSPLKSFLLKATSGVFRTPIPIVFECLWNYCIHSCNKKVESAIILVLQMKRPTKTTWCNHGHRPCSWWNRTLSSVHFVKLEYLDNTSPARAPHHLNMQHWPQLYCTVPEQISHLLFKRGLAPLNTEQALQDLPLSLIYTSHIYFFSVESTVSLCPKQNEKKAGLQAWQYLCCLASWQQQIPLAKYTLPLAVKPFHSGLARSCLI